MFIIVPMVWTWAPLWSGSCSVSPNPFIVVRLLEGKEQVLEDKGGSGPGGAMEAGASRDSLFRFPVNAPLSL